MRHILSILFAIIMFAIPTFAQAIKAPANAKAFKPKMVQRSNTDVPGAYVALEDIDAAEKSGTLEYYQARDLRGAKVNAPDGKRIIAAPMGRLAFAELGILGGYAWVAIRPDDLVRRLVVDGVVKEDPFALDACGNPIRRIAYPEPRPVPQQAAVIPAPQKVEVRNPEVATQREGDVVVNNNITIPAPAQTVVVPSQERVIVQQAPAARRGNVVVNNRISIPPPAGPPAPVYRVPERQQPPAIVPPQQRSDKFAAPTATRPYAPSSDDRPVAKEGWGWGKKILVGVGIAGGVYLVTKALHKDEKKAGPPSGSTGNEGLAGPPTGYSIAGLKGVQGSFVPPPPLSPLGMNPAQFAAQSGRGVYISIGTRF